MISYGKQSINPEDISAVGEALLGDFLTCGPIVKKFEEKFADYVGAKFAVAVSSGTAALHLACLVAGLKLGDEVITSPITFAASANCALYCQAKPIFVDINDQGLIDEEKIEEKITPKTKIIIPVHYSGLSCEMEKIRQIAKRHNLIVVEDACHALGAKYKENGYTKNSDKESRIGDCRYSDMACFSFHPVKHITTGEGGMVTTNSQEYYEKLLMLRHHGITKDSAKLVEKNEGPWYHEMQELGFNYRITDFQCALGISQLKKVDEFVNKRREIAKKYDLAFKDNDKIFLLSEKDNQFNPYHLYVIQVDNPEMRLKLFNYLKENGVSAQVHYLPVYWHPYYQRLGYQKGICPKAEEFYGTIISLPIYPDLKSEEQDKVIHLIKEVLKMSMEKEAGQSCDENNKAVKKEVNTFIFKYQKEDVNEKLGKIIGNDFKKYREEFDKTQNYQTAKHVPEFPLCVSLELVNRCNLNCIMCYKPHHSQPFAQLSIEELQKIMTECQENKMPSLILGLGAETLLYPKVKETLEIIRSAGVIDVFFGTNGVLLNDNIIESIFDNKISRVEISLDSATPETYKKVRGHDMLPKIEENIEKLLAAKKARQSQLPIIRLCFVVMDINKHETEKFIQKWKDKVDYIDFQRCVDFSKMDDPVKIDSEVIKDSFCSQPFYSLNVWGNGKVTPCCTFYGERLVIGDIHEQSLKEIWDGEKMQTIREQILSKKFNPICQKCLYFRDRENIDKSFQK